MKEQTLAKNARTNSIIYIEASVTHIYLCLLECKNHGYLKTVRWKISPSIFCSWGRVGGENV